MIKENQRVAYRGGNTEYRAILTSVGFNARYTLVSVKTGRHRYNVPEKDLVPWSDRVQLPPVKASDGRLVRRQKNWHTLPNFAGSTRRTWVGKSWVYKRALSDYGKRRSEIEACVWFLQSGGSEANAIRKFGEVIAASATRYRCVPVAECYLLDDGTLVMERVLPVCSLHAGAGAPTMDHAERIRLGFDWGAKGKAWPTWVGNVDSAQIGFTRKGKLVAYDL
jgi:hypothetical protein